jgi:crotonobetainyl-CoA:carnitine CoA-transferase CaiB-like acyl-CoA transferase
LLSQADILVHGYRPGALDHLGYDPAARRSISPGLIDISLSAYGWSGPWATRRGFDSLVQMSARIAETGMHWRQSNKPVPLPRAGYFVAAAIRAVTQRLTKDEKAAHRQLQRASFLAIANATVRA